MWRLEQLKGGGAQRRSTMADQLYLENIDEFVTDQNKIVRSQDWGLAVRQGSWAQPGRRGRRGALTLLAVSWEQAQRRPVPTPRASGRARTRRGDSSDARNSLRRLGGRAGHCTDQRPRKSGVKGGALVDKLPRHLYTCLMRWLVIKDPALQLRKLCLNRVK